MRQGFDGPLITYTWSQASTYSYTIDIRVPTSPTTGSFPVAILLHGAGGNGAAEILSGILFSRHIYSTNWI
ncbi:MAG: hypothetical protein CM15mV89_0790 [Caudoviricetes sp.]|nr:MAG: hypothetical protein CM15mV89_0790 [Caudoviricetes sp.]